MQVEKFTDDEVNGEKSHLKRIKLVLKVFVNNILYQIQIQTKHH